jgi:hypothetical protein
MHRNFEAAGAVLVVPLAAAEGRRLPHLLAEEKNAMSQRGQVNERAKARLETPPWVASTRDQGPA